MKKKCLLIFGTRPEAIKMAPLIQGLKEASSDFDVRVCVTAQHREMLDQVLEFFQIVPDYDLNLMRPGQDLYQLTANVITGLKDVLDDFKPDYVFTHGDTTTSMASSLAGFYAGAKICHIEAGLRTYNKYAPFPEEMNRQITSRLTDLHFSPTERAKDNLLSEGITENVYITGNTVIDALLWTTKKLQSYSDPEIEELEKIIDPSKRLVLVTGHRRENFGEGFINMCHAILEIADKGDVQVIYPVHLNPNVKDPVHSMLGNHPNIQLIAPLAYPAFIWLMTKSYLVLTDSGGVQEEAPSLGKPVLVMRETTERPEAVEAGTVLLVGTDRHKIVENTRKLLREPSFYDDMAKTLNPYGDGKAVSRIVDTLKEQK